MKAPEDAIIPEEKLTRYLLVPRKQNDKSAFLAQGGFTLGNRGALEAAIRHLAQTADAIEDSSNEYGDFYRIEGEIEGPNGRRLAIVTIWLRWNTDGSFRFVTLKPLKRA